MPNAIEATHIKIAEPERPALYVRVYADEPDPDCSFGTSCALLKPPEDADGLWFRLPSTADADRTKERERLIGEVVESLRAYDAAPSYCKEPAVFYAARALAAFDADNGGNKG